MAELGVTVTTPPDDEETAVVRLSRGASAQGYSCKVLAKIRFDEVAQVDEAMLPQLVLTPFVPPKTADALRRAGIQYIDLAGNAWIEFGDVLIDVRGHRRPTNLDAPRQPVDNLLSTGRAQVVLVLITWPELWTAPRRDLARAAGVSVGQAHNTMVLLTQLGYHDGPARPGRTDLLEFWAASFPTGLAQRLTLGTFNGKIDTVKPVNARGSVFISGERAIDDLLRPSTLTVYVNELDPRLAIVNRWRADGPPNITVRRKFWRAPAGDDEPSPPVAMAPWPLVYADLAGSDDPRVATAATEWRDRFV